MLMVYLGIAIIIVFLVIKMANWVERKFTKIDGDINHSVLSDKMDDIESEEEAAERIAKFKKEHKNGLYAGEQVEKFLRGDYEEDEDEIDANPHNQKSKKKPINRRK